MPPSGGYQYILVIVDMFTRWVEAYPTRRNDARAVLKALSRELIPRFGIPQEINSDRGTHFTNKTIQTLTQELGVQWKLHTPYHPQSSGMVERINREIKATLSKLCQDTSLKWPGSPPFSPL